MPFVVLLEDLVKHRQSLRRARREQGPCTNALESSRWMEAWRQHDDVAAINAGVCDQANSVIKRTL